jgi:uncharacterized protein YpmS
MTMDIAQVLTAYVIPVLAIVLSVAFWLNGRASAKDAKKALDEITNTTRGWQNDIMKTAINMLDNTRIEVVGRQVVLDDAKVRTEAVRKVTDAIQSVSAEIAKTPKAGEEGKSQLRSLELLLGTLLEHLGRAKDKDQLQQQLAQAMAKGKQDQSNDS